MPLKPIPINKGLFLDIDPVELGATEYAAVLQNLMLSKAGSNVDRPDFTRFAITGAAFPIDGLFFFKGFLVIVTTDRKVYKSTLAGVVTDITGAAILPGTAKPRFIDDGTIVLIIGGGTPLEWNGAGNCALATGTPPDSEFIEYLDGYFIAALEDSNEMRWAGPADRTIWSAGNFFSKEGRPDNIASLFVLFRELWVLGTDTVECFQNFGDSMVPFERTFFIDRGCSAPRSVVEANNTLYFLDDERHFVRMDGRTPIFISDALDTVLKDSAFVVDDCFGQKIEIDGFYLIVWVFPSEERCFVHDFRTGEWFEWSSLIGQVEKQIAINCHVHAKAWSKHLVGDPRTGTVWEFTRSAKGTASAPLRRTRRTGFYDHGTGRRKRSNYYLVHVLRGQGTPGGVEPFFELRINDDNGGWSDPIQCPLGFAGANQEAMRIHAGGIYRKRQLEVTTSDAVDFKLIKLEEDVEIMQS